jgi:hypothetical protein
VIENRSAYHASHACGRLPTSDVACRKVLDIYINLFARDLNTYTSVPESTKIVPVQPKVLDCTSVKCMKIEKKNYFILDANGNMKSVNRGPCCRITGNRMRN